MRKPSQVAHSRTRTVVSARRAISDFVDANVPKFDKWLDSVVSGIPAKTRAGKPVFDANDCPVYLVKPDPLAALKALGDLCEYVLPKLSRSDAVVVARVEHGGTLTEEQVRKLSLTDLKRLLIERGGDPGVFDVPIDDPLAEPVDVVARMVPETAHPEPAGPTGTPTVPDWLKGQE